MKKKLLLLSLATTISLMAGHLKAQTASVQVIHNAADVAADTVDIWISTSATGNVKLLDNVAFRTASPFLNAPAGTPLRVIISPKTSTDTLTKVKGFTFNLAANAKYILVASGITSATGYVPNSITAPFHVDVFTPAMDNAATGRTNVLVYHGVTDAPTVSISTGTTILVPAISYTQFYPYLDLATSNYLITVKAGSTVVGTYSAPLQTLGLGGKAITIVASGFSNPAVNSNGKPFGLWVALPTGGKLVELATATGINELTYERANLNFFPNPATDLAIIDINSAVKESASVKLFDLKGSVILESLSTLSVGQNRIELNIGTIEKGIYFLQVTQSNKVSSAKIIIE